MQRIGRCLSLCSVFSVVRNDFCDTLSGGRGFGVLPEKRVVTPYFLREGDKGSEKNG